MTSEDLREALASPDVSIRAYHMGRLMRQAKPDDVFTFVSLADIRENWLLLERYLGTARPFWTWLLEQWKDRQSAPE